MSDRSMKWRVSSPDGLKAAMTEAVRQLAGEHPEARGARVTDIAVVIAEGRVTQWDIELEVERA